MGMRNFKTSQLRTSRRNTLKLRKKILVMKSVSGFAHRVFTCLWAAVLATGIQSNRIIAEDAASDSTPSPTASPASEKAKPHHAAKLKGWETKGEKPKSGDPLTTASLAKEMREAIASIVLATKSSTTAKFDEKSKTEKPFWSGLKGAATSLEAMDKGLAAKDEKSYLTAEGDLGHHISEVNVSYKLLKKKDDNVEKGLVALNRSYRIYDEHYGPEAARKKAGGDLTDAEKANLDKMRTQEAALVDKIKKLKAVAKKEKNKVALEMCSDLERKCKKVGKSKGDGVDNYTHECTLVDDAVTEFDTYSIILTDYYPGTEFVTEWTLLDSDWKDVDETYTTFESTEYTASFDYTSESVTEYGDYYDVEVEVSDDEAASAESEVESYSEDEATEDVADEDSDISEDEGEDVEAEDEDSDGDEESLDDEGDSEEMEADDEADEGDDEDDSDDDDSSDDDSDDGAIGHPSAVIMVAEVAPDLLARYWPTV